MNYRTQIVQSLSAIGSDVWDRLVNLQADANPFLSFAFLHALHESGCATAATGWQPHYLTLWQEDQLHAALPLYLKSHSYGEYVFDWAWADAYQRHGLAYYPKLLAAIPFTPVAGARLLTRNAAARNALIVALKNLQQTSAVSSCHILYPTETHAQQLKAAGFLLRSGVQFHWHNHGYRDFTDFLTTLERKKRKNILAERRHLHKAGITHRQIRGTEASADDWAFFYRCYCHTYRSHHSSPYLNLDFFQRIARDMSQQLLLIIAEQGGQSIAASLSIYGVERLYGRYWGALVDVRYLHFETAYYQPLEFCIASKIRCFEGGAQGEHKLARGFLPQITWSAHWLAQPEFADAVGRFLQQEQGGITAYVDELNEHTPFRIR